MGTGAGAAGRAATVLGRLAGPIGGVLFAIDILARIAQAKIENEEAEEEAKRQFERSQRALRLPQRVIEIPGPPLDVPLPQSVPQIAPVILPEIVTAPPARAIPELQPAPLEIPVPTAPQVEISPQIEIEAPALPELAPKAEPKPVVLPPLATPGFGVPTQPVIPQVGPATKTFLGRIVSPSTRMLPDLISPTRLQPFIGNPGLTRLRIPRVDLPPLPDAPPIDLPQPFAPGTPTPTRTGTEKCEEVKRRRRKKGKCREGFFRESPGKTKYVTWRERDCATGIKLR